MQRHVRPSLRLFTRGSTEGLSYSDAGASGLSRSSAAQGRLSTRRQSSVQGSVTPDTKLASAPVAGACG